MVMGRRGCGVMNSLGWHADQVDKTLEQLGGVKKDNGKVDQVRWQDLYLARAPREILRGRHAAEATWGKSRRDPRLDAEMPVPESMFCAPLSRKKVQKGGDCPFGRDPFSGQAWLQHRPEACGPRESA